MMSMTISVFVLAGIISTFLYLGRSGVSLSQYSEMEAQARVTFQTFGSDCRKTTTAAWTNANTLQLTVDGATVTYSYDSTAKTFTRTSGGSSHVLAEQVDSFAFKAFDININEIDVATSPGSAGPPAKMIQVDLDLSRQQNTTSHATDRVVSARYVLRNKKVA